MTLSCEAASRLAQIGLTSLAKFAGEAVPVAATFSASIIGWSVSYRLHV